MESNSQIQSPAQVVYMLYFAFVASIFIYGVVLFVTGRSFLAFPEPDAFVYGWSAFSVVLAIASFYVVPMLVKLGIENMKTELGIIDSNALKEKAYALYLVPFLLRCAVCETIAIFGLVLAFMGTDGLIFVPFAIVSLVLLVIHRPNVKKEILKKIQGTVL